MARNTPGKICPTNGCTNYMPCETHTPKPWRNTRQRRPHALTGHTLQRRNHHVMQTHAGICWVCHKPGADQIDHITPYAEGGTDQLDNLAPIHSEPCHTDKTRAEALRGRKRANNNENVDWAD